MAKRIVLLAGASSESGRLIAEAHAGTPIDMARAANARRACPNISPNG
jgi:hypothetical protein